MRIVFMGTPDLAAYCLERMIDAGHDVVAVVTAPDRPAGRGRKLQQPAVKQVAWKRGLPVLQPESLKSETFIDQLKTIDPDLQVVVAFRMLPEVVWSLPSHGTFNTHASYLPQYRGAAPINWVIINGERETGVSTFLLDKSIDTGKILIRERLAIEEGETAGSLHEKMKEAAAGITLRTIKGLLSGELIPVAQSELLPDGPLKKAPKIFREDCRVNWERGPEEIVNLVRGLNPQPGAFTDIHEENGQPMTIKLFEAEAIHDHHLYEPGTMLTDHQKLIMFASQGGFVKIQRLQLPGKKVMSVEELLRGYTFRNPNLIRLSTHFGS